MHNRRPWLPLALLTLSCSATLAQPVAGPEPLDALPESDQAPPVISPGLQQAKELILQGHAQEAVPLLNAFVAAHPLQPEAYFYLGVALDALGQPADAVSAYSVGTQHALATGYDSAELRLNAGNALLQLGYIKEAVEQYKRAEVIDSSMPAIKLNLARALLQNGNPQAALTYLQQCKDMQYEPQRVEYYAAKALLKLGKKEAARARLSALLATMSRQDPVALKINQEFAELVKN